jgi:hypothetical protein
MIPDEQKMFSEAMALIGTKHAFFKNAFNIASLLRSNSSVPTTSLNL